ncbi:sulfite exporter TauE/SafE family protein [Balneolaceae bacterium ANBcel3]|nr:sulfite exporter TauE/SafE family protein [Balneolaceae bacterium ANBcel3]
MDFLVTGFIFGLVGSAHCIGMCGPIAIALPGAKNVGLSLFIGRLLYSLGRTVTYTLMGGVLGLLGMGVWLAGYQQFLSVLTGVGIVAVTLWTWNHSWIPSGGFLSGVSEKFSSWMKPLMQEGSPTGLFLIGIVNGFLPCGLVYVALAAALSTGRISYGMGYMALFGLGTLPVMTMMALSPGFLKGSWQLKLQKAIPWLALFVGILLILRGLSLGIPFISPDLSGGGSCH